MSKVKKRDGSLVEFDGSKICKALGKAYKEKGKQFNESEWNGFIEKTFTADTESVYAVEEIQDKVQRELIQRDYSVGLAYILYRAQRQEFRVLAEREQYIKKYIHSNENASSDSEVDANANSTLKNVATLKGEVWKSKSIDLLRYILEKAMDTLFPTFDLDGKTLSDMYVEDLFRHWIYKHDESSSNGLVMPYCVAVNNYPFLQHGTRPLDGISGEDAPESLESYVGQYCNMIFLISSQYLGAVADAGFFVAMNYYLVKEFGEGYRNHLDDVVYKTAKKERTIKGKIIQTFQGIVYGINQPSSNRSNQSPFTNISYYDSNYFKALYNDYYYPDGTKPEWEDIDLLQKMFMKWFNAERSRCLLTFPVETMALLTDGKDVIDKDYKNFNAEMYAEGHSFFTYLSDNADSLSSCCRLRNQLEKNTFSFTNGNIGVATGSKSVITINLNRVLQDFCKELNGERNLDWVKRNEESMKTYLKTLLNRVYKYHYVFNEILWEEFDNGMLPVYSEGYISLNQQFLTIGINGLNEASMFYGLTCTPNDDYKYFCNLILDTISESNREGEKLLQPLNPKHKVKFNTEFVPAEGLGVKNYNWDKADGYVVPEDRNCYTSYFFLPDDKDNSVLDLMKLHGSDYASKCDGGMACHINLQENLSKSQYLALTDCAIANGTNYYTYNIPQTECKDCGHIEKKPYRVCPKCGSKNLWYWTRIIGYLRPIKLFSNERAVEAGKRVLHLTDNGTLDSVPINEM